MTKLGSTWGLESIPGRDKILDYLIENYKFTTVIDIGCGKGDFFNYLNDKHVSVKGTGIDMMNESELLYKDFTYIKSNFNDLKINERFDLIFSSHTIEHNPNTEDFLKLFFSLGKPNGIFCLIWPPPKPQIVGGHVHVFNLGLMLYNVIRIGVNCSNVKMLKSGYNLCLIGRYDFFKLPKLTFNAFEIELLKDYFPFLAKQAFNGDNPPNVINL